MTNITLFPASAFWPASADSALDRLNRFADGIGPVRFGPHGKLDPVALATVAALGTLFSAGPILAYHPNSGQMLRRGGEPA